MRSTRLFETMIKFILFISVFSPISVAQDFSSYSGDSLQFSAGSSAHGLQTFLYKLPWLLRGLENVKDPTEVFENITNEQCTSHISYIINQLSEAIGNNGNPLELDNFIMQMVDAWGKFPSGLLSGHFASPGDFQECVEASGVGYNDSAIRGSYCLAYIIPFGAAEGGNDTGLSRAVSPEELREVLKEPMAASVLVPSMGTCFPASCSTEDAQQFVSNLLNITGFSDAFDIALTPCRVEEKAKPDGAVVFMIALVGVIVFLGVVSTGVDLTFCGANGKNYGGLLKALNCFSWYANAKKWANTDTTGKDNLGCFHGLRFLSMAWVVLGHSWMVYLIQNTWNSIEVLQMYKQHWTLMAVLNASVSVDTFFVLSGALVAYNVLKELDKRQGLNVPMLYIHRYLRLTPTYGIVIGITATLTPYIGNGPRWWSIEAEAESCREYWWQNLLYITTIYVPHAQESKCISVAWYLSNDMIYFLVSPLFIYVLWRWKTPGLVLISAWIVQATVHTGVVLAEETYPPTLNYFVPAGNFSKDVYNPPWTRSAPYAVGLLLGYLIHTNRKKPSEEQNIGGVATLTGWVLSTGVALSVVFGPYRLFDPANIEEILGGTSSIIYGSVHRLLWSAAIAWVIYACVSGRGGPVNDFLSWKAFIPLGRLTYCVYMTSVQTEVVYANMNYQPVHYSVYHAVYFFLGNLTVCLMVGFVLTITVETPFLRLEKLLFEKARGTNGELKEVVVALNISKDDRPITIWNYKLVQTAHKTL